MLQPGNNTGRLAVDRGGRPSGLMRLLCRRSSFPRVLRLPLLSAPALDVIRRPVVVSSSCSPRARWPCPTSPGSSYCRANKYVMQACLLERTRWTAHSLANAQPANEESDEYRFSSDISATGVLERISIGASPAVGTPCSPPQQLPHRHRPTVGSPPQQR